MDSSSYESPWPFQGVLEIVSQPLHDSTVQLARWRESADRTMAFSLIPDFLSVVDRPYLFHAGSEVFAAPYPNSRSALCSTFEQVTELMELFRPSLLCLLLQNLLIPDRGRGLIELLKAMPTLQVIVYSGWDGVTAFFEGVPEANRLTVTGMVEWRKFHHDIGRYYGVTRPQDRRRTHALFSRLA